MRLLIPALVAAPVAALVLAASPAMAGPLANLSGDLNGDGLADRARLVESPEGGDADLLILAGRPDGGEDLALRAERLVWVGGVGQQPGLRITEGGSLQVTSMNEGIGRDRWYQTLTIAWRDGVFVLAGFTYSWYDTLDPANAGSCDVNLLTGRGELTRGPEGAATTTRFRTAMRGGPVAGWDHAIPPECGLW